MLDESRATIRSSCKIYERAATRGRRHHRRVQRSTERIARETGQFALRCHSVSARNSVMQQTALCYSFHSSAVTSASTVHLSISPLVVSAVGKRRIPSQGRIIQSYWQCDRSIPAAKETCAQAPVTCRKDVGR